MKKLLLATAVATLASTAANAAPTVYGKAFLTADYLSGGDIDTTTTTDNYVAGVKTTTVAKTSVKGASTTALNSDSSRIGVKGAEPLTANTDVVYQLEYGVDIDSNNNGRTGNKQFYSRDTYLGVANKQYGTFLAGRLTAIDDNINYANVVTAGQPYAGDVLASVAGPRVNNAFEYFSPKYNGVQFMAMHGISTKKDYSDGGSIAAGSANGAIAVGHPLYGLGVKYEPAQQPFRAGLTYIAAGDDFKYVRASGDYKINPAVTVGGLYQNINYNTGDNENTFTLSGSYKTVTPWTVYAQGDVNNNFQGVKDADRERAVIGGKYAFTPAATGHIYADYLHNKGKTVDTTNMNYTTKTGYITTAESKQNSFGVGAGLEYNF